MSINFADLQTDFNDIINDIGQKISIYIVSGAYNTYGDYSIADSSRWISGVTGSGFISPRVSEDLLKEEVNEIVGGGYDLFIGSGLRIGVGDLVVTSVSAGSWLVNEVTTYDPNGIVIYHRCGVTKYDKD